MRMEIEDSGKYNLFVSHFVMGCEASLVEFTKTETDEIRTLHKWLSYKDEDYGMRSFSKKGTQYVDFVYLIDLANLNPILEDLKSIYKEKFPFSEKPDFIKACFEYSLYGLEDFINEDKTFYGPMWNDEPFEFYYYYDRPFTEYIDYAIDKSKSIEYYKQYYKKVVQLINGLDYEQSNDELEQVHVLEHAKLENTHFKEAQVEPPSQQETNIKEVETLSSLITHESSQELVNAIKIQFKNIKGKQLKLLFLSLQELDLIPKERMATKFYNACKKEFDWHIASYPAMNDYKSNIQTDKESLSAMQEFLKNQITIT